MDYAQAMALLNEAADVMATVYAPHEDPAGRAEVRHEIRCQLWEVEKLMWDRGFAEGARLHTELTSPTQPL